MVVESEGVNRVVKATGMRTSRGRRDKNRVQKPVAMDSCFGATIHAHGLPEKLQTLLQTNITPNNPMYI